ncbi:NAD(+)/NADH kinase [Agromyces sp. SYSU K20354]|uniref:ATP-NAD kinase family protein n=1 Tax=Agromyces cavernae TaxID=2898659 RepID=UPI001E648C37|nr:NAD(+)/NADH kinase [Agromyces cavernae]MCD2442876.1 NAD(+)/NADH kinase [Agromyces cavernae]
MLGLIVNPVAGIGGPAGLAGSDGADVQARASQRGGASRAAERALTALAVVASARPGIRVLTVAGPMGEDVVREAGLEPVLVAHPPVHTTGSDTSAAARALADAGASLVLFAGGDGTARDVAEGLASVGRVAPDEGGRVSRPVHGEGLDTLAGARYSTGGVAGGLDMTLRAYSTDGVAAIGIPAGVKMYSPVFAVSPRAAGGIAAAWLVDGSLPLIEREVLDVDEAALRRARVEPQLYGTLAVPYRPGRTQARKAATPADEFAAVRAAARGAASALRPGVRYLLGPGGTMSELARELGVSKTPLGVDVVLDGRRVLADASERELLDEAARGPAQAVVTVIGGQGFLLGRGNQQLSARVLGALGDDPLLVVAPEQKLIDLGGRPLLVDTGDADVDAALAGFVRVITGQRTTSIYPVHAPEHEGEGHAP